MTLTLRLLRAIQEEGTSTDEEGVEMARIIEQMRVALIAICDITNSPTVGIVAREALELVKP